jgi:hypothetical protein
MRLFADAKGKKKNGPGGLTGAAGNSLELVRGLGGFRGLHVNEPPAPASVLELHVTGDQGKQCVILAHSYVLACAVFRAALPDDDRACIDKLAAKTLYAQPLSV